MLPVSGKETIIRQPAKTANSHLSKREDSRRLIMKQKYNKNLFKMKKAAHQ